MSVSGSGTDTMTVIAEPTTTAIKTNPDGERKLKRTAGGLQGGKERRRDKGRRLIAMNGTGRGGMGGGGRGIGTKGTAATTPKKPAEETMSDPEGNLIESAVGRDGMSSSTITEEGEIHRMNPPRTQSANKTAASDSIRRPRKKISRGQ